MVGQGATDMRARWRSLLDTTVADEKQRLIDRVVERPPHKRWEYELLPEYQRLKSDARMRLDAYERALNIQYKNGVRLGYLQVRLMGSIRTAIVKRLFGAKLIDNVDYLAEKYDMRELFDSVVILFPRRSGKTTVQCISSGGITVSQPDGNLASFNITMRQGRMWLSQTKGYMEVYKNTEFHFRIVQENMNEFFRIYAVYTATENTVSAYPGSQGKDFKNMRGVGIKLFGLFIDEGYWIAEAGVPVIIPLLANGAFLVVTSSVGAGGARAGLMAILDARYPDGTLAVKEINYTVTCEDCKAANIPEGQCTHIMQRPQHFQGNMNQERTKVLLSPFEGVYEKELQNQQDKPPTEPVWSTRAIQNMTDPVNDEAPVGEIKQAFVCIDPHGGGQSQGAIVTVARTQDPQTGRITHLVLGAGTINTQITMIFSDVVVEHITRLRTSIRELQNTLFIINCEANMAYAAPTLDVDLPAKVDNRFRFVVMKDDKRTKGSTLTNNSRAIIVTAGTRTDNHSKAEMVNAMTTLLNQGRIYFHRRFISTALDGEPGDLRVTLDRQLRAFRRRRLPPPRGQEVSKFVRFQYECPEQDDFVMALMLTSYAMQRCRELEDMRRIVGPI